MPVLLLIVGLIVVALAIYAALGRGGELSAEWPDYAPLDLGPVSAADVALLRPPTGAWGYDTQATDEALGRIADSIRDRDVRIVALEQLVTDLSRDPEPVPLGDPFPGARHRRDAQAVTQSPAAEVETVADTDPDAEAFEDTEPIDRIVAEPIAAAPVPQTTMRPVGPPLPWPQSPGQDSDPFAARSQPAEAERSQPAEAQETAGSRVPVREPSPQRQPPPERSHG